jgi:S1-C subfamily serine protease
LTRVRLRRTVLLGLLLAEASGSLGSTAEDPDTNAPQVWRCVAQSLAGRRARSQADSATRGLLSGSPSLRDVFRTSVSAVPFVVAPRGNGSAVLVSLDPTTSAGVLVTSRHVVEPSFQTHDGVRFVKLLFFDPQLAGEVFDSERIERCGAGQDAGPWCVAFQRSLRTGVLVAADPERDLALLSVSVMPPDARALPEAAVEKAAPGDDVAVIGHPHGLLWTLTKGIISAVRPRYPMGSSVGTVIQTQAPVSEGSSGGPLLTHDGQLLGIVSWQVPDANGLGAAIGVDEVHRFASRLPGGR